MPFHMPRSTTLNKITPQIVSILETSNDLIKLNIYLTTWHFPREFRTKESIFSNNDNKQQNLEPFLLRFFKTYKI
jgi:hypothetical protein